MTDRSPIDYSYLREPWVYDAGGWPVKPANPESYAAALERNRLTEEATWRSI